MDEIFNQTNSLSLELDEIIARRNFLPVVAHVDRFWIGC